MIEIQVCLIYCMLDHCCHCRSQSVLCHRLSTPLKKGCRQENPLVSSSVPQTPTGTEALGMKPQLKGSALSLVSFEHCVSLSPSLLVHAGPPWPNVGIEFCLELCALSITGSFCSQLEVRSHVMLLTVPTCTFSTDCTSKQQQR